MNLFETPADISRSNPDLPSVPKQITVGIFAIVLSAFADACHENDIRYKAALILMSTAEETNYHEGSNKPATMIMVR